MRVPVTAEALPNDRRRHRGRDVVVRLVQEGVGSVIDIELLDQVVGDLGQGVTTTHDSRFAP